MPDELQGEALLSQIRRLMHERKCGQGIDYFKTVLGLKGVKLMIRDQIPIDTELQSVIEKVTDVATRT